MSDEQHIRPPAIVTKAGVGVDGPGYLAGEHPAGRTTIKGTPVSADVDVFYELDNKDWQCVASTTSQPDGTWSVVGLNPDKKFNVVARHASYGGVIAIDVQPSRTDVVTLSGAFTNNESFNGVSGFMTIESGMPPFTASVIDPLPYGLSPLVVDGRKLLIDGTSDDEGIWNSVIRVTASNGVWVDIPVVIEIKKPSYDHLLSLLNPVSWWRLDEASGTVALDARGYKNGVYEGSPSLRSAPLRKGSYGSAGFLSGEQQCLVGEDSFFGGLFGGGNSATIMFWFRLYATNGQNRLIQYFINTASGDGPWRIIWSGSFEVPSTTQRLDLAPTGAFDGGVHFLVVTKGAAGYALYVDGELKQSNPATGGGVATGGYGLCFPAAGGYGHYPMRCYLSDVAVFNRDLSGEEVAELYSKGRLG